MSLQYAIWISMKAYWVRFLRTFLSTKRVLCRSYITYIKKESSSYFIPQIYEGNTLLHGRLVHSTKRYVYTFLILIICILKLKLKQLHCNPGLGSPVDRATATNQSLTDSIPSQGTCLGCRPGPSWGPRERQPHIDIAPLFLPLLPSL